MEIETVDYKSELKVSDHYKRSRKKNALVGLAVGVSTFIIGTCSIVNPSEGFNLIKTSGHGHKAATHDYVRTTLGNENQCTAPNRQENWTDTIDKYFLASNLRPYYPILGVTGLISASLGLGTFLYLNSLKKK